MGIIRMLAGAAMLAAFAAHPAAAKAPLDILQAGKQAEPAKTAPTKARTATKKPPRQATKKPRAKAAAKTRTTPRAAAVRRAPAPRSAFAQESNNVMRGPDTIALVAMLPWWRSDPMQTIRYGSEAANSKVMAATDAWLVQHGSSLGEMTGDATAMARADGSTFDVALADPDDVNEIDLAAEPSSPPERSFIHSLIAVLGGALAAASAARFLFV